MSNGNPVSVLAEDPNLSQARIKSNSLSSTETLQGSEDDISTTTKAVLVQQPSISTNVTNEFESVEAGALSPERFVSEDVDKFVPRTVCGSPRSSLFTCEDSL
jgi:hypothetical protein